MTIEQRANAATATRAFLVVSGALQSRANTAETEAARDSKRVALNRDIGARSNEAVFYHEGVRDFAGILKDEIKGAPAACIYVLSNLLRIGGARRTDRVAQIGQRLAAKATLDIDKITAHRVGRYLATDNGAPINQRIQGIVNEGSVEVKFHRPDDQRDAPLTTINLPPHVGLEATGTGRTDAYLYSAIPSNEQTRVRRIIENKISGYGAHYVLEYPDGPQRLREVMVATAHDAIVLLSREDYESLWKGRTFTIRRPTLRRRRRPQEPVIPSWA